MTAPVVLDRPMNRAAFLVCVDQVLVPTLRHGDTVIMDNLPAHEAPRCVAPARPQEQQQTGADDTLQRAGREPGRGRSRPGDDDERHAWGCSGAGRRVPTATHAVSCQNAG